MVFDGSDVGLSHVNITAVAYMDDGSLLFSMAQDDVTIPGIIELVEGC